MARIKIVSIFKIGGKKHIASSWQVALDKEFTKIVDQSLKDTENLLEWITPLKKIDEDGFYSDTEELYARVKVHTDNYDSEWVILPVCDQTKQENKILY